MFPQHQLVWGIPNSQFSLIPFDSLSSLSACLFQLIKDVDNSPVQRCHSSHFDPAHHYCTCCHRFFQIPHHYQHCHGSRTSSASLVCQWDRWCPPPAVHPWFRGHSSLNMVIGCLHLETTRYWYSFLDTYQYLGGSNHSNSHGHCSIWPWLRMQRVPWHQD